MRGIDDAQAEQLARAGRRQELIEANLWYARFAGHKFARSRGQLERADDFEQAASEALVLAADLWQPERGGTWHRLVVRHVWRDLWRCYLAERSRGVVLVGGQERGRRRVDVDQLAPSMARSLIAREPRPDEALQAAELREIVRAVATDGDGKKAPRRARATRCSIVTEWLAEHPIEGATNAVRCTASRLRATLAERLVAAGYYP